MSADPPAQETTVDQELHLCNGHTPLRDSLTSGERPGRGKVMMGCRDEGDRWPCIDCDDRIEAEVSARLTAILRMQRNAVQLLSMTGDQLEALAREIGPALPRLRRVK